MLGLAACVTPAGSSSVPPVAAYSEAFQVEMMEQVRKVPPGSPLDTFIADSIKLRCAVQAARGDAVGSICADG